MLPAANSSFCPPSNGKEAHVNVQFTLPRGLCSTPQCWLDIMASPKRTYTYFGVKPFVWILDHHIRQVKHIFACHAIYFLHQKVHAIKIIFVLQYSLKDVRLKPLSLSMTPEKGHVPSHTHFPPSHSHLSPSQPHNANKKCHCPLSHTYPRPIQG